MSIFARKDLLNINARKYHSERKETAIPEKSTSEAATEESSELEKSRDASVLEQCEEIHLFIQK